MAKHNINMTREELKTAWLNIDYSNVKVKKEIIVDLRYLDNKWWPNHGYVTIMREGPDGFSEFSTHEKNPLQYAKNIIKENDHPYEDYSKYKLVIKE